MTRKILILLPLVAIFSLPYFCNAQCKYFGQKMCVKYLDDYRHNGQNNSAAIAQGETAELNMIFYKGHDYRLVFCAEEHLGQLAIVISDTKGNVVFDNSQQDMAWHWDFSMQSTQRFIIKVTATQSDEAMEGCITISLGVKPSIKKGFN
jgi:hypothetical protein